MNQINYGNRYVDGAPKIGFANLFSRWLLAGTIFMGATSMAVKCTVDTTSMIVEKIMNEGSEEPLKDEFNNSSK